VYFTKQMQTVPTNADFMAIEFAHVFTLESNGDVAALGVAKTP
jgi:hypothetical protein